MEHIRCATGTVKTMKSRLNQICDPNLHFKEKVLVRALQRSRPEEYMCV
jgi:hypothetical protein